MKIAFVIATMRAGGAERVAATLSAAWIEAGHSVQIITFEPVGTQPFYSLPAEIELQQLGLIQDSRNILSAIFKNIRRVIALRRALRNSKPDVTLAFITETNVLTLLANLRAPWPTLVTEHIHPQFHRLGKFWEFLRRLSYPYADMVVVLTTNIAEWMRKEIGGEPRVLQNPVARAGLHTKVFDRTRESFQLIAVGRLAHQKGYDFLIDAFARAVPAIPQWTLTIYGDGPERASLEQRIASYSMTDLIHLAGVTKDISAVYNQADAVVHAARYEGYPMVIAEALAAGKPIIAVDSPGAARELLGDGRYGVLTPSGDVNALASALVEVLSDRGRLESMAATASEAVSENDVGFIAEKWLKLFDEAVAKRKKQ